MHNHPLENKKQKTDLSYNTMEKFNNIIALDFETSSKGRIFSIGAIYNNNVFKLENIKNIKDALCKLDLFAKGADYILGHNIINHDLAIVKRLHPDTLLLNIPVIDTLFLSPLAFPENPYHKLVKGYKLLKTCKNDPVADARIALELFKDEINAFSVLKEKMPGLLSFFAFAFKKGSEQPDNKNFHGIRQFFASLSGVVPDEEEAFEIFRQITKDKICTNGFKNIRDHYSDTPEKIPCLAYVISWISVSGGNSILPFWVDREFKETSGILEKLRYFCGDDKCSYCRQNNNSKKILQKYFGFDDFRTLKDGRKLQKDIVDASLAGKSIIGILPTGGGKSICYQIPALHRFEKLGGLAVVISPLKALMKDQVDNLNRATGTEYAGAINGSLTMPERAAVIEKVRLGDIGILYISPELLRNKSTASLLESRNIRYWIFDEAHCLSKWGHDFRPDYLNVTDFINKYWRKTGLAPFILAYTATAKKDVLDEIKSHFKEKLNLELKTFAGGVDRDNLNFQVWPVTASARDDLIYTTLRDTLEQHGGSGIVYCSTRRKTEELSDFLNARGIKCGYFHAGRKEPEKRNLQDGFLEGKIAVICATNAFGMGIDKQDIRVVIHADIPGSLENYLQEAGRAGRDMEYSECILLYEEDDIENQFASNTYSRLSIKDIKKILGILKKRGKTTPDIIITPGEIKRLIGDNSNNDTKIKTGVSWLERQGFLKRDFNKTLFFQGIPLVKNMDEAEKRIKGLNLSYRMKKIYKGVLFFLFNADKDSVVSADDIAESIATITDGDEKFIDSKRILMVLSDMSKAGLIKQGAILTAYVKPKGKNSSIKLLKYFCDVENELIKLMEELEPLTDQLHDGKNIINLRLMSQKLKRKGFEKINAGSVELILRAMANDKGKNSGKSLSITGRRGIDQRVIYMKFPLEEIKKRIALRQSLSIAILEKIISLLPDNLAAGRAEVLASFFMTDIHDAIQWDVNLASYSKDAYMAIDNSLLYMHDLKVITMQSGLGVFRQAMTLKILKESKKRQYTKGDFEPLNHHYGQKNVQVHVMDKYARIGINKIKTALKYVTEYFSFSHDAFIEKYFKNQKDIITTALTAELYKKIIHSLGNSIQESIAAYDLEKNILVFAGPGSGKTKIIVHRCAWLVRAKSVNPSSILVLCYNHHVMIELKKRIKALTGKSFRNITIMTYHGFAMKITGNSFLEETQRDNISGKHGSFNKIIIDATMILKGQKNIAGIKSEEIRETFLSEYRYIFVDEYQDIDEEQYEFLSAITGRKAEDKESKISIMAVGDDDQSIYGFRHANIKYIKQYKEDYNARTFFLVENYRSTHPIIEASNHLISFNKERMKTSHPVRINNGRKNSRTGPNGVTEDDLVQLITVSDLESMGASLAAEIDKIKNSGPDISFDDFAVVSRTGVSNPPLVSARMALAQNQIPFCYSLKRESGFSLLRVREIQIFLNYLEKNIARSLIPRDLKQEVLNLYNYDNPWIMFIKSILQSWCDINPLMEISVLQGKNFVLELLMERSREARTGKGVFLGTVHSVKGMEFKYIFILDSGWEDRGSDFEKEEERRLYYVGMTRAEKKLFLYDLKNCSNPHTELLKGNKHISQVQGSGTLKIKGYFENLKISIISMKDLFISYPGLFDSTHPIHGCITKLSHGDKVFLEPENSNVYITRLGRRVGKLSRTGSEKWRNRISKIVSAKVLAMVKRKIDDSENDTMKKIRIDSWELPIIEVLHRSE